MAKQTLPVNFKDDILASSMGGKRRYNLIQNDDGTYSLEDVTEYTQTGSDFGAGQINATNKAVNESCDKANVIDSLNDIVANQADGMIAGAKAVAELNGNINQEWTQIYNSNNNAIHAIKIGHIVFARFSIQMPDTTERTLTFNNKYAPAQGFGFAAHLERNGKLAGESWVSRRDDSGSAPGTFTYKAAQNNYGFYTGCAFWFSN